MDRVISRIKGNKDAIDILGYSINNMINNKDDNNGKDNDYEDLDVGSADKNQDFFNK